MAHLQNAEPAGSAPASPALDRRQFVTGASAAAIVISGGSLIHPVEAWGLEVKALKPDTMLTLIKMARDIYPHDRLADRFYAVAMKSYDEKSGKDSAFRVDVEKNVAEVNAISAKQFKQPYAQVGWESQRVNLLRAIQKGKFFQGIRSGLVVSLYNQPEVWPVFGYEGESASQGGYIARGFGDIAWL
ncbi:MAG: Twin-arginine translocation pathway signal [Beijerinckiaceae bacterium]|nr:Twin-arginine translocation pathway signal [Beijerinckiaceae bacterium]